MDADAVIEKAIELAATEWRNAIDLPGNLHLRDRVTLFASRFQPLVRERLPDIRAADDQVLLLIVLSGLERSGLAKRPRIASELGVILPPDDGTDTGDSR